MSPWITPLWCILGAGAIAYALTGGADLGAGLWGLLASGPRREAQRRAIEKAIAPIWEANHVWMIFVIVTMFGAFPRAFAAICIALHVPIALLLLGIIFRGSSFVFRAYGIYPDETRERWRRVFAWSSSVTPLFLGAIVGGVSTGEIRVTGGRVTSGIWAGWCGAFAALVGVFALVLFALLAAVYLAAETEGDLQRDFRRRALATEIIAAIIAAAVFACARPLAPELFENLARSPWTWPVQLGTAASAVATIVFLVQRRPAIARWTVALQVGLVVVGWGVAMNRHFILPDLTAEAAVTQPEVLPILVVVLALGAAILAPSLWYLYRVFKLEKASGG